MRIFWRRDFNVEIWKSPEISYIWDNNLFLTIGDFFKSGILFKFGDGYPEDWRFSHMIWAISLNFIPGIGDFYLGDWGFLSPGFFWDGDFSGMAIFSWDGLSHQKATSGKMLNFTTFSAANPDDTQKWYWLKIVSRPQKWHVKLGSLGAKG